MNEGCRCKIQIVYTDLYLTESLLILICMFFFPQLYDFKADHNHVDEDTTGYTKHVD